MANSAIQNLIRNQVVAQHVSAQGYRVSDADVIQAIEQNQAFFVGGRFSRPAYKNLLRSQGLSEQRYEFDQRQGMEINQFAEGLLSSAFYTPTDFRRYIALDGESRGVEYMLVTSQSLLPSVVIDAEQIAAYYDASPGSFQIEEAVTLEYIEVDYRLLLDSTSVDEDEALVYFNANRSEFGGPEERHVRHILLKSGADESAAAAFAQEIYERLVAGEDFESLAVEYSIDTGTAANGGDLGWISPDDSPAPEFEDALFSLEPGDFSEPVLTEFGFHLIRLDAMREGVSKGFPEVRDELLTRLREEAAQDSFADLLDELDDRALESFDGLASVSEAMGLELGRVDEFTRSGGLPLGYSPALVDTVFSLEVLEDGENSPIIDLEDGRAVVVQVVEHRQPELKPLAEVSAAIKMQLEAEEAVVLAAATGAEILDKLKQGSDPIALADDLGLSWAQTDEMRRGAEEVPPELAGAIFRAAEPADGDKPGYESVMLSTGDFAVFRVTSVNVGQPDAYSLDDRDLRKQQLAGQLGNGQITALVENLVDRASISIAADLLGTQSDLR
jgi:peptidyl-prolyl cis-trans isomerase D